MARQLLFKNYRPLFPNHFLKVRLSRRYQNPVLPFLVEIFNGRDSTDCYGPSIESAGKRVLPINSRASEDNTIIVGAGVAGLVAAYRLSQGGVRPQLFEASERLGGRIFTQDKFNDQGMFCELGGELIDSAQSSIIDLCRELHVSLEDFTESDSGLSRIYYARQKLRTETELQEAAKPFLKIILKDLNLLYEGKTLGFPPTEIKWGLKLKP